jgi:hypothetical protein
MGWFSNACSWIGNKASAASNWVQKNAVTIVATAAATAAVIALAPVSAPAISLTFATACIKTVVCATAAGSVAGGITGGIKEGVKAHLAGTSVWDGIKDGTRSGMKSGATTGAITGLSSVAFGIAGHYVGGQIGGSLGATKGAQIGEQIVEKFGETFGAFGKSVIQNASQFIGKAVGTMNGNTTGALIGKAVGGTIGLLTGTNDSKKEEETEERQLTLDTAKKQTEQIEAAKKISHKADNLLRQGKYQEAAENDNKAFDKSQFIENGTNYKAAQKNSTVNAEKLKCQANINISQQKNDNLAKTAISAINLHRKGEAAFDEGKYDIAHDLYKSALAKTASSQQKRQYAKDLNDARYEIEVQKLNLQGDVCFAQGQYEQALDKYCAAYGKASSKAKTCVHYSKNKTKAQIELSAANLILKGDKLLSQKQYAAAAHQYQEASRISQINKDFYQKYMAHAASQLCQQIKQMIHEGAVAENSDNPEEAEKIFDNALAFAKENLELWKNNKICADYIKCLELKIAGNKIFNEANSHDEGNMELEKLKNIAKQYQLAEDAFTECVKYDTNFQESLSCVQEYKATLEQKIKTLESSDSLQFDYCVNITNDVHHQQGDIDVVELQGDLIANI